MVVVVVVVVVVIIVVVVVVVVVVANSTNCNFRDFWEAEFCNWHPAYNWHPQNRGFRGSDCLVLPVVTVVLVARDAPAEFYNWHPIFNCEVYFSVL